MSVYKEIHKYNFEDREPVGESTSLFYRINKKQDTAGIILPLYETYEDPETGEIKQRLVLEELEVTPSVATQIFYPDSQSGKVGFSKVTVKPILTGNIEVKPTMEEQYITPEPDPSGQETYFDSVTVKSIDGTVDDNILPGNIRVGISILGVVGNYDGDKPLALSVDTARHILHMYQNGSVNGHTAQLDNNSENISA